MSSGVEEKPIFVLYLPIKWMVVNIVTTQTLIAVIIFAFFFILLGLLSAIIAVVVLVLFTQVVSYLIILKPYRSWRMELYNKHIKVYYHGDLVQDPSYSEIVRIGRKRYALLSRRYVLYGNGNRAFVVVPSNPRRKELGGLTLLDWLNTKINASTDSAQ